MVRHGDDRRYPSPGERGRAPLPPVSSDTASRVQNQRGTVSLASVLNGIGLCGVVGVVSDLLQPIAPIANYVIAGTGMALAVVTWLLLRMPEGRDTREVLTTAAVGLSLLLATATGLRIVQAVTPGAGGKGALAANFEGVEGIQSRLLGIESKVSAMADNVEEITLRSKVVDERTARMETDLGKVKLETSEDPNKELANLGVTMDQMSRDGAFYAAAKAGDVRTMRLLAQAGFSPSLPQGNQAMKVIKWSPEMKEALEPIKDAVSEIACTPSWVHKRDELLPDVIARIGPTDWRYFCLKHKDRFDKAIKDINARLEPLKAEAEPTTQKKKRQACLVRAARYDALMKDWKLLEPSDKDYAEFNEYSERSDLRQPMRDIWIPPLQRLGEYNHSLSHAEIYCGWKYGARQRVALLEASEKWGPELLALQKYSALLE